jgi:PST family polysaccharide transporter
VRSLHDARVTLDDETPPKSDPRRIGGQLAGGLALRVSRYPLQALFVLAVPPILGPEAYGAYATCVALFGLVVEATDPGTVPLFGRFLPGLPPQAASTLVRQVLWSRLALAAGPGTLLLALLWTPRPEDPLLFGLVVAAVFVVPFQQVFFARLYARGQLTRFMARDPLRSGMSLALVVPGYLLGGLVGAMAALVLAQVVLVGIGAAWLRPRAADLAPPRTLAGLPATLRFGVAAALPGALSGVALLMGTPLLARAGRPEPEVAAFNLAAYGLVLVMALVEYPFAALMPTLGQSVDAGRHGEASRWLLDVSGRASAAAALVIVALVAVGDPLIRLVLGPGFAGVYPNLLLLVGGGIFPALVSQAGLSLAVLARTPSRAAGPAVVLALVTGVGTLVLAGGAGAPAAAAALVAGLAAQGAALLAVTPGLARLALRPVGSSMAAAGPALVLGGLEAAGWVALAPGARIAVLAAVLLAAAWPLGRLLRRVP